MTGFYSPPPALAEIVGREPLSLLEVSDRFWAYVAVRGHDFRVAEVTGTLRPLDAARRTHQAAACLSLHLRRS
jgi:chromatin remodeling complex protein RSC6